MTIHIKDSGTWKQATAVYIKDAGSWKTCKDVYIKEAGAWKSLLYEVGSQNITSAGTTSFTVPAGIESITYTIYGAGGGSGANNQNGDAWVGGGGGAGGKRTGTISVTPGETLTMVVGEKGYGASYRFNSSYSYNQDGDGNNVALGYGTDGENTIIKRGSTALATANGGTGGAMYYQGDYGEGGSPEVSNTSPPGHTGNGDGEQGSSPAYKGYSYNGAILGGTNGSGTPPAGTSYSGTGYGNGGGQVGVGKGINGQDGAIFLEWYQNVQTYTSGSGSWTVPAGVTTVLLSACGGGGQGGGGADYGSPGGGSGGYTLNQEVSVTPGSTISYSIGSGGTGNGGNTTFGSLTFTGGTAGTRDNIGSGGSPNGEDGRPGNRCYSWSSSYGGCGGRGGSTPFGAGGLGCTGGGPGATGPAGNNATGYGAGGGGGCNNASGGTGTGGYIKIIW